jgi:hypothetical protein
MQFVEIHVVELSQNLHELQVQMQHYYWGKFFLVFDDGYEILVEMPSYSRQCVARVFMDYTKDFNEKTLCSA